MVRFEKFEVDMLQAVVTCLDREQEAIELEHGASDCGTSLNISLAMRAVH
jgi:hypothetical protein